MPEEPKCTIFMSGGSLDFQNGWDFQMTMGSMEVYTSELVKVKIIQASLEAFLKIKPCTAWKFKLQK